MGTTTEPLPETTTPAVGGLPALALSSATRALRATAVGVLLLAIVAGGAAVRFHRADHPDPPRSADERAYLALAHDLVETGDYGGPASGMDDPLHWPPAAPALFALAQDISPGAPGDPAPRSIYTAQAIVGTLTILVAFAAAALLAGVWAGLAAAAATAFYPPLYEITGKALSEPLGALGIALAILGCAWAARRPREWRFALAGVALGLTLLARADLSPAVPLVAIWAGWVAYRAMGWRRGVLCGLALVAGAVIAVAPWVRSASERSGQLVPVSTSGGSAIFVGTYLPGDGTMFGLKRSLGNQLRLQDPRMADVPNFKLPQERILDLVANRHPELDRDAALQREARENLDRYALHHPLSFARMMGEKAARMWVTPNRGPHAQLNAVRLTIHIVLIGLALAGTLLAVVRVRRPGLGAILAIALAATAVNAVFLSEPRHLLPMVPALFATGAAGWALLARRRTPARPPQPT
jgi:4-amino-4-deoxy-L-arabinose transferase-like glycosyltransferase